MKTAMQVALMVGHGALAYVCIRYILDNLPTLIRDVCKLWRGQ